MLPEAFHQVSLQEPIWFGRCLLKNSKMAVKYKAILMCKWDDFSYF